MKSERYAEALDAVISRASDKWDHERMRDALIEARAKVEAKLYAMKQEEFRKTTGGK